MNIRLLGAAPCSSGASVECCCSKRALTIDCFTYNKKESSMNAFIANGSLSLSVLTGAGK